MKRSQVWTVWAAVLGLTAGAAWAGSGKEVEYGSGTETVKGYLARPEGEGPHPGLVVIHEWWGLNDWVKEQADRFAEQGYMALAVDLYRGKVAASAEEAHELMRGVPEDRAKRDLLAAQAYLTTVGGVDKTRIGAIGWCMGGGYALTLAQASETLAAAVVCYGHLATEESSLKAIHAPVLGIFGAEDRGIPVDSVKNFEAALKAMNHAVDVHIYEGVGHAFMNPNNKAGYNEAKAKEAWAVIDEWLTKTLKLGLKNLQDSKVPGTNPGR